VLQSNLDRSLDSSIGHCENLTRRQPLVGIAQPFQYFDGIPNYGERQDIAWQINRVSHGRLSITASNWETTNRTATRFHHIPNREKPVEEFRGKNAVGSKTLPSPVFPVILHPSTEGT
jgi:hypothetical protein